MMKHTMALVIIMIGILFIVGYFWFDIGYKIFKQDNGTVKLHEDAYSAVAYFAGGCFWCVEKDFEKIDGVGDVISGYSGGATPNPTYSDHVDHREAVMVLYNPDVVSYANLVHYFFRHHDGTDPGGSFYDRGDSYTSAIYYQDESEKKTAQQIKKELDALGIFENPLVTSIEEFHDFTFAEDYHQNYYKRDPVSAQKYKLYRKASGRDDFIETIKRREAGLKKHIDSMTLQQSVEAVMADEDVDKNFWESYIKPSDEELKAQLSDLGFKVTQRDSTERAFSPGNLNNEKRDGIFVDILSGEPLYSSTHKFDSGTGWPSFTQPIDSEFVVTRDDNKLFYTRTEVRSRYADNHLGHVFNDGPKPTGQRWCMNGAALEFIPLNEMKERGYGDYLDLFN